MATISGLLRLVRWPGAIAAGANAATAFLLAHSPSSAGSWAEAVGAVGGGALVYAGGVALNDAVDAERDATLHPERPIPSGDVTRDAARALAFVLFAVGVAVSAALAGPWAGAATAAAAVFALAYDLGGKRLRLAGAFLLGFARAANAAAGALAAAGTWDAFPGIPEAARVSVYPAALLAYAALLTFASAFEEGRPPAFVAGAFAVGLVVAAALPWPLFYAQWRGLAAAPYLLLAGTLVAGARDACSPDGPGMAVLVRHGVFGFLLADSAWLVGAGRYDAGAWLVIGYVALRLLLLRARS